MPIYDPTIETVRSSPGDRRVSLILRHSVRYPIIDEDSIFTAGLTPEGVRLAEELGRKLTAFRPIRHIVTNFIGRCMDTAQAIARGARNKNGVGSDKRLSHPFIEPAWDALPIAWPHDAMPSQLKDVLDLVFSTPDEPGVLDIYVTHDTIVGVVAGYLMDEDFSPDNWPNYLEGILVWKDGGELCASWRGRTRRFTGLI